MRKTVSIFDNPCTQQTVIGMESKVFLYIWASGIYVSIDETSNLVVVITHEVFHFSRYCHYAVTCSEWVGFSTSPKALNDHPGSLNIMANIEKLPQKQYFGIMRAGSDIASQSEDWNRREFRLQIFEDQITQALADKFRSVFKEVFYSKAYFLATNHHRIVWFEKSGIFWKVNEEHRWSIYNAASNLQVKLN